MRTGGGTCSRTSSRAELLLAHRRHRHRAPPRTPEPRGVSPQLCTGVSSRISVLHAHAVGPASPIMVNYSDWSGAKRYLPHHNLTPRHAGADLQETRRMAAA